MDQRPKTLQSDILAPDDVVVLIDGNVKTVAQSYLVYDDDLTCNFRLLSLRPEELGNHDHVKQKILATIDQIAAGGHDALFVRAATLNNNEESAGLIRDTILDSLHQIATDETRLGEFIESAKKSLKETYDSGIYPTDSKAIEDLRSHLIRSGGMLPEVVDRLYHAEGVPFVVMSDHNVTIMDKRKPVGILNEPAHLISIPDEKSSLSDEGQRTRHLSLINAMTLLGLTDKRRNIFSDKDIKSIPGMDYSRVKYYMERKRGDVQRHNRTGKPIYMLPAESVASSQRLNGLLDYDHKDHYDEIGTFKEAHFLLNYYQEEPQKSKLRERFDPVVEYHDAVMGKITQNAEERLQALRIPPRVTVEREQEEQHPKTPLTADEAIARADRFARSTLPGHYKLRSYLQPTSDHRIALKLTDDAGDTVEKVITLAEPNAERALDIKRRVQAHLMDIPGVVPYRGPSKEGSYHVAMDELVPTAPPRSRVSPKYGEYRVKLDWRDPNEEMSIPLGVQHSEANHDEALRRAEEVSKQLNEARQANAGHTHLPLTKRDIIDHLRQHVQQQGGRWDERTFGEIDQFPTMLRFPFAQRGHQQDSWLQIEELRTDGDPNYTWILPINVVVNGQRLANASTHVNLHVRDRHAAEERAIETVNRLMQQINALPPQSQWAIDPERPTHLLELSEPARNASPNLIDKNRLTDLQNELRSPFQKDLTIQAVGEPTEQDGLIHFSLAIVRGREHGVTEPVLAKRGDDAPPVSVLRRFAVPVAHREDIPRFVEVVNNTFRNVIGEEYDPRSARNYDAEQLRKLKTPKPFNPNYAPNVFDRAIETHLPNFTEVSNLDEHVRRARSERPEVGFAGRVN